MFKVLIPLLSFIAPALVAAAPAAAHPSPQQATTFSLIYGYPLLAWQKFFVEIVQDIGANAWYHSRQLSTADDTEVVKPNVDTLYSEFIFDLSKSNAEITIPDVPAGSFKLFSFYDPF